MKLPEPHDLSDRLTERFGLRLQTTIQPSPHGTVVAIRPIDLHPNEGFSVETTLGWRSLETRFRPGAFAGARLWEFGRASMEERRAAAAFLTRLERDGGSITLSINGAELAPGAPEQWPKDDWDDMVLSVRRRGLVFEDLPRHEVEDLLVNWAGGLLGAVLSLARIEEIEDQSAEGLPEGAKHEVTLTRYERSRVNRAACIAAFGATCRACGFDFARVYGPEAAGFIHVHHVVPVSELGPDYIVDPTRDLVPVCPNCHAYIHLRNPPYKVAEVREVLNHRGPYSRQPPSE
jgi:5-methylcytosine-specific restriction enzyme A